MFNRLKRLKTRQLHYWLEPAVLGLVLLLGAGLVYWYVLQPLGSEHPLPAGVGSTDPKLDSQALEAINQGRRRRGSGLPASFGESARLFR